MSETKDSKANITPARDDPTENAQKEGKFKINKRTNKIVFTGDEATLRMVKSGSVKQKMNLENTKLKINIDNLNSAMHLQKQNETYLEKELERYRKKLTKYKDKVKSKDNIIADLLLKIERDISSRELILKQN